MLRSPDCTRVAVYIVVSGTPLFAPLCRPKILPVLLPRFTNPRYLAYALFGPDLSVDAVVGDTGGAVGGTDEVPQASSSARAPAQSDREVAGVPVRCGVAAVSLARSRTTAEPLHRRSGVERPENMGRGEPTGKSSPSTQPAPPTVRKDHPQDRYGCSCDLPAGPQLSLVLRVLRRGVELRRCSTSSLIELAGRLAADGRAGATNRPRSGLTW